MKVCFIWVEKFRNFEDLGINLSSASKFSFDLKTNRLTKKDVNNPLPDDFFGSNITDVMGIVGKNGVGKSNAIALICKILKSSKTALNSDFIIVTEEDNQLCYYSSFENGTKINFDFDIQEKPYSGNVNKSLKVVFFSNVFDDRRNGFSSGVTDISVNRLANRISLYHGKNELTDFEKQVRLIDSKTFSELNIDLPNKVNIVTRVWLDSYGPSSIERSMPIELYDSFSVFNKTLRDRIRKIEPIGKFINLVKFSVFIDFVRFAFKENRFLKIDNSNFVQAFNALALSMTPKDIDAKPIRTDDALDNLFGIIEESLGHSVHKLNNSSDLLLFERKESRSLDVVIDKIRTKISFAREMRVYIDDSNIEYNVEGIRNSRTESFFFDYSLGRSKEFVHDFVQVFGRSNLFDINWVGISSGHKAYLNIFASLYQELKLTKHPNLLLCIDEGDLYLHPIWQTEFFNKLLFVLPSIFNGSIQLVLTSHSPFLLSDLPNQNITILDKYARGSAINGIDLKMKTFGGNLYNLYSEPFFLGDRRTSEFAQNKIKDLVNRVDNIKHDGGVEGLSVLKRKALLEEVNLIGDEVIKFMLERSLHND